MRISLLCTIPLLALAACHAKVDLSDADDNASDANVHVAMADVNGAGSGGNKVSIDVPGFKANVSLPNIDLGGHIDIDGMKIAPNSKVSGFDASSDDRDGKDGGTAKFTFTNSDKPDTVIAYYKKAAADASYSDIVAGAESLTAKKAEKSFTLAVTPQGTGSQGTITVAGKG